MLDELPDTFAGQPGAIPPFAAFLGTRRIAAGTQAEVARSAARHTQAGSSELLLVFDAAGRQIELDAQALPDGLLSRSAQQGDSPSAPPSPVNESADSHEEADKPSLRRRPPAPAPAARGRGRPQLGVVAREVTLLPRHWEWLASQPGGASAALRRLVDGARRTPDPRDAARAAQERAYRFLNAMAGNLPGYEEALRALFAGKAESFQAALGRWPPDIAAHAALLAQGAFAQSGAAAPPASPPASSPTGSAGT